MINMLFITFLSLIYLYSDLNINVNSEHAILMNAKTKRVLFEKKARDKVYPASTTKIATALWALQKSRGKDLSCQICQASVNALRQMHDHVKKAKNYRIPAYLLEPDGTTTYIKFGEKLSLITLMNGMLLSSGNDAANVIAESFDGDINLFMHQLNVFLRKLGIKNSNFYIL